MNYTEAFKAITEIRQMLVADNLLKKSYVLELNAIIGTIQKVANTEARLSAAKVKK